MQSHSQNLVSDRNTICVYTNTLNDTYIYIYIYVCMFVRMFVVIHTMRPYTLRPNTLHLNTLCPIFCAPTFYALYFAPRILRHHTLCPIHCIPTFYAPALCAPHFALLNFEPPNFASPYFTPHS